MTHCLFCSTAATRWVWYLAPTSKICSTDRFWNGLRWCPM